MTRSLLTAEADYWRGTASRAWAEGHRRTDRAFGSLGLAVLDRVKPAAGESVLDIGCGSGHSVLELARRVGAEGRVLGADIGDAPVAQARARVAAAGLAQASLVCADVAAHPFPAAGFDLAFSQLGVMFFGDSVAALANVHRALKPGGRIGFGVFRTAKENPWPAAPMATLRDLLPPTAPPAPDGPGMFSWSDPARVRALLGAAGFSDVAMTPVDLPLVFAAEGGVPEAVDFALQVGPLTRAPGDVLDRHGAEIRERLARYFESFATPEGVVLPGAFWIIEARA